MDSAPHIPSFPPQNAAAGPSRVLMNQQIIFDFTKRKRWADLLVTELTEAIMLVLSATGQVWFCSPACEELLGWKDEEIVDGDLTEVMNEEDRATFQRQFAESIRTRVDLLSYVRLQCKTDNDLYPSIPVPLQPSPSSSTTEFTQIPTRRAVPKEVLFEIKGYAQYVESYDSGLTDENGVFVSSTSQSNPVDVGTGEVFKCFFAMARPYPSRNTAMLNTFLELKIENERLQQRLETARARLDAQNLQSQQTESRQPHQYTSTSYSYPYAEQSPQSTYDTGTGYLHEDRNSATGSSGKSRASASQDDAEELGVPARKKSKRSLGPEQHVCVTCGRTDSPEWRKGPLGPKTLCNACGLRWAKTVRRDPVATAAETDTQGDVGVLTDMPTMGSGGFGY